MKTKLLIFILIPLFSFSQKLKTKKDKILIDEKEVAIFEDKIRDNYVLFDLQGNKKMTVVYKTLMEGQTIVDQWLVIANSDESKKTEIPYEVLITSLSSSKIIFHLLSVKYQLFDANGFNQSKIDEFFNTNRESIGEKATKAKISLLKDREEKKSVIERYNPSVAHDGTVNFGGNMGSYLAGRISTSNAVVSNSMGEKPIVKVYDLDNILVASAVVTGNYDNEVNVELFNSKSFKYAASKRFSTLDNSLFYKELIGELLFREYTLGHQAKEYIGDIRSKKVDLAKQKSNNLYNVKGYVVDEKGDKYVGLLSINFERLNLDLASNGGTNGETNDPVYGKTVSVKYSNEKGQERIKSFEAKNNIKFVVNEDPNNEVVYQGMKVKGDAVKKILSASSLSFNNAYFYKMLFTENENSVYVDPVDQKRYVIKIKSNDSGQIIDNRENQKIAVEVAEYLQKCQNLAKEINSGAFDLKKLENLVTIIKEFNSCAK